jgi:CubicO group peptidase (beta-lactamase class C family)
MPKKIIAKNSLDHNQVFDFDRYLEDSKTVAFLVIQNDTIKYENYFNKYNQSSVSSSFSMAKSILSILIGIAIDDGLIKSVNEPITNYIPELKKNGFDKVTIEHLLQMTSGLDFDESYISPFSEASSYYYGTNIRNAISKLKLKNEPGQEFEYTSGSPQILGLILERVINGKTVTQYLEEKLWIPLGMEYEASWSLDRKKNGLEKTFCCINARARDFAKIGRLYLNKGHWDNKQIVSEAWVKKSTKIESLNGSAPYYQYQWWIPNKSSFMAEGHLGQFIYANPSKKLIIVRLGEKHGGVVWWSIFDRLSENLGKEFLH